MKSSPYDRLLDSCREVAASVTRICLLASISEQSLHLFEDGKSLKVYSMSSSKRPPSCVQDSYGTPWGLHEVCEKIGEGQPEGMVFKGRVPIGLRYWECPPEEQRSNLITTRILRLRGLESGVNQGGDCDTYARMVYIHGTNHEDQLGSPSSAGCLQVGNRDALELFDHVPVGTLLLIEK